MSTVKVRLASSADLPLIQSMNAALFLHDAKRDPLMNMDWPYQEVGESYFKRRIDGGGICLVAVSDAAEVVGYLAGAIRTDEEWRTVVRSELENMYVLPSSRGQGAGRALIDSFKSWSAENGATQVMVEAFTGNEAIRFYEKCGMTQFVTALQCDL